MPVPQECVLLVHLNAHAPERLDLHVRMSPPDQAERSNLVRRQVLLDSNGVDVENNLAPGWLAKILLTHGKRYYHKCVANAN